MSDEQRNSVRVHLRPFRIAGLDELFDSAWQEREYRFLSLLRTFAGGNPADPYSVLRERYERVLRECSLPELIVAEPFFEENFVEPFKQAVLCYVSGLYSPCIAQTGMIAELVCIVRFERLVADLPQSPTHEIWTRECTLTFDKAKHFHRLEMLKRLGELSGEEWQSFDRVRILRNNYLHSPGDGTPAQRDAEALEALKLATKIVSGVASPSGVHEGRIVFPDSLRRHLERLRAEGAVSEMPPADSFTSQPGRD